MKDNPQVPFQVQSVIDSMLNPKDNVHLRGNYRMRLDAIRRAIDDAIARYDREVMLEGNKRRKG